MLFRPALRCEPFRPVFNNKRNKEKGGERVGKGTEKEEEEGGEGGGKEERKKGEEREEREEGGKEEED